MSLGAGGKVGGSKVPASRLGGHRRKQGERCTLRLLLAAGNEPFLKPDENVWGARKHLADGAQSAFRDFRRSSEALQALQRAGTLHLAHATGAGNR